MENKLFFENLDRKQKTIGIIHRVYLTKVKNARIFTASTKTKSEVRGGGRKPWRQKGTGNARAGSIRSPLFVGGGVIFGPKPRLTKRKINKKEARLALLAALYLKEKQFIFLEDSFFNSFDTPKTKKLVEILNQYGVKSESKALLLLPNSNKNIWLASRNLENINLTTVTSLNLEQILHSKQILLAKSSLELINNIYGKQYI